MPCPSTATDFKPWQYFQSCQLCIKLKRMTRLTFCQKIATGKWQILSWKQTKNLNFEIINNTPKTVFQRVSWRSLSSLINSSWARYGPLSRRVDESSIVSWDLINSATRSTVQSTCPTSSLLQHSISSFIHVQLLTKERHVGLDSSAADVKLRKFT